MHKGTDNAESTDAQDTENACKIATDQRIQKIKYREYTRDREEEYTENRECRIHKIQRIPYTRKYWRELNLAVGLLIAIAKILADLNLAVR